MRTIEPRPFREVKGYVKTEVIPRLEQVVGGIGRTRRRSPHPRGSGQSPRHAALRAAATMVKAANTPATLDQALRALVSHIPRFNDARPATYYAIRQLDFRSAS